ncbi:hypothetical protein ACFQAS_03155 [Halopenitus salinus]|uniref:Uncharacterized protein n=1 Tax=Halopenitus salinus TaxID=1198295 RepID=A0ABD5UXY0_9EURY
MSDDELSDPLRDQLLSAARTAIGDELRSLTYFTEDAVEQIYLRGDLERSADLVGFAERERMGFHSKSLYRGTQLDDYQFTIRVFERGYLTRVIAGDHGVWATTDEMRIDRFEELASALTTVLEDL